ncbi:hypothetical protein FOCC_FOCC012261 [Frankliniella occidentalis]|nr:hypothetical protein FOCC_FOCC012261 [Frankliniella occidentalis]
MEALVMDDLILSINKLQDKFIALGKEQVNLPQIVVVGAQSAGKSSVLESLVRRNFLPRGTDVVTRCPLILQLVNCPKNPEGDKIRKSKGISHDEWGEFLKNDNNAYEMYEIGQIESQIMSRTASLAGDSKNISRARITLRIFSPSVLTLTLVDLPGVTKVPVGDQPIDIEDQILDLIKSFIENPESIILAVTPGNTDMATSDSLKLAKQVDPKGERTLAVVTKVDKMEGSSAEDVLTGKCIPVKLGIIGVINRSQEDLKKGKSIEDAIKNEEDYLQREYPELADKHGSAYLAKKLQTLLVKHIQAHIPEMRHSFLLNIDECKRILDKCGGKIDGRSCLEYSISTFCESFGNTIKGESADVESAILTGGAKLHCLFENLETSLLQVKPCEVFSLEQVILAIRLTSGVELPLVLAEHAFDQLMKPLVKRTKEPSLECISEVCRELKNVCRNSFPEETATRFPAAGEEVCKIVDGMIDDLTKTAKDYVLQAIFIEERHITRGQLSKIISGSRVLDVLTIKELQSFPKIQFRSDPNFTSSGKSNIGKLNPTIKDMRHAVLLGDMLNVYYEQLANRIWDTVVKATMALLVKELDKGLQLKLASQLNDKVDQLFIEGDSISQLRSKAERELQVLEESLGELDGLDFIMTKQ